MDTLEHFDRDLEARKHLWRGLQRMTPAQRAALIRWGTGQATQGYRDQMTEVKVTSDTGTVHEAYLDCCMLAVLHRVSLGRLCVELEQRLKRL